jgi:hypothetical protein
MRRRRSSATARGCEMRCDETDGTRCSKSHDPERRYLLDGSQRSEKQKKVAPLVGDCCEQLVQRYFRIALESWAPSPCFSIRARTFASSSSKKCQALPCGSCAGREARLRLRVCGPSGRARSRAWDESQGTHFARAEVPGATFLNRSPAPDGLARARRRCLRGCSACSHLEQPHAHGIAYPVHRMTMRVTVPRARAVPRRGS